MDYNNQLTEIEVNRQNDLTQLDQQYQNAINETEQAYKQAADQYTIDANDGRTTAVEQLMETQTALTEQAVKEIEQQREQSEKDYIKEQAGAYADWKKQSDAYGVHAEKMASNGLTRSGYSESSQVQMYSDYQSRISTARDVFKRAELNFTNAITNARLQNNAALAQIALDAFQRQSEIALAGLTAKNGLLSEWTSQKLAVNTRYDNKYQTILDQIYREEQLQLERERMAQDDAQFYAKLAQDDAQHSASLAQSQAQFEAGLAADKEKLKWQETQAQLEREWEAQQDQLGRDWQAQQDQIDRDWRAQQSALDRAAKDKITGATITNKDDLGNGGPYAPLENPFSLTGGLPVGTTKKKDDGTPSKAQVSALLQEAINAGTPIVKNYSEAKTILNNIGYNTSGLMASDEWARHRNSGNATDPAAWFSSYQDYLIYYLYEAYTSVSAENKK